MKANKFGFRSRKGQGLVEFALAFPMFLLIILGIFEIGRLFFTYATVFTASRETARYGATVDHANDCAGMINAGRNVAFLTDVSDILIYYDQGQTNLQTISQNSDPKTTLIGKGLSACSDDAPVSLGDRIIVLVTAPYMPVIGPIIGIDNNFTISSLVSRTLVKEVKWEDPSP